MIKPSFHLDLNVLDVVIYQKLFTLDGCVVVDFVRYLGTRADSNPDNRRIWIFVLVANPMLTQSTCAFSRMPSMLGDKKSQTSLIGWLLAGPTFFALQDVSGPVGSSHGVEPVRAIKRTSEGRP